MRRDADSSSDGLGELRGFRMGRLAMALNSLVLLNGVVCLCSWDYWKGGKFSILTFSCGRGCVGLGTGWGFSVL